MQSNEPQIQPNHIEKDTPTSNRGEHSFFHSNSQLSQIPANDSTVNRRLFGTPISNDISNRIASTPFQPNRSDTPNPYRMDFDDEEFENNHPVIDLNPRKRRLDDLFGNIDDIVNEENLANVFYSVDAEENAKKKARSEEELDKELIKLILRARADNFTKTSNFIKQSKLQQLEALQKFKERNLSESYPQWPCIPVAISDRSRIYVRMHSEDFETKQLREVSIRKSFNRLLGEQSEDIWNDAQKIVEQRMVNSTQTNGVNGSDDVIVISETNLGSDKLWVDKYRPKSYIDLLSDESTNRSLLTWLKMWDKIVFNR